MFTGDEHYPLEVGVLDTADEDTEDLKDDTAERQDNGDDSKKDESFIVNLHGLPYSATLEDVANFLEGFTFTVSFLVIYYKTMTKNW